jgi:hypothetical protein
MFANRFLKSLFCLQQERISKKFVFIVNIFLEIRNCTGLLHSDLYHWSNDIKNHCVLNFSLLETGDCVPDLMHETSESVLSFTFVNCLHNAFSRKQLCYRKAKRSN